MDWEKVKKATDEGDAEELARLQNELLNKSEIKLKRFMDEGTANVPHAIMASTFGGIVSASDEEMPQYERSFKLNAIQSLMERHGVSVFKDMSLAVPGDVIEIDTQKGHQTYLIEGVSRNKLKLVRTATSFDECRGSRTSMDRDSKNILFGLHLNKKDEPKDALFFFFYIQ